MTKSRGYDGGRLKRLLTAWTLGSAVVIVMPLILLIVGWIIHSIRCREGGGGAQWCQQGDQRPDFWYDGWAVMIFAFVWSYVLFIWLAGYGHAVLSHLHGASKRGGSDSGSRWKRYMCSKNDHSGPYNMGLLTGATILFGNLSFLLGMILAIPLGSGREHVFRRASIIPLSFLLWALFCLIFSCWLLQFQPLSSADSDADVASSDYRRVADGSADRGISDKKSSSNPVSSSSRGRSRERTNSSAQRSSRSSSRQSSRQDDRGKKKGFFSGFRSKSRDASKSTGNWNNDSSLV